MVCCSILCFLALLPVVIVVLYYFHCRRGRCTSKVQLNGKTAIVTGSNTGCGKEIAKDLAKRGATVIIACRDTRKGEKALEEIIEATGNQNVHLYKLDLASLKSVQDFAEKFLNKFKDLHLLINNAGVMHTPYKKTEDGFEFQFGVNHLGHFALTNLLLERLAASGPSRIVNVSSVFHKCFEYIDMDDLNWNNKPYDTYKAYGQSKLANVLFTKELHRRLSDKNVTAYAVHPGWVNSELARESGANIKFQQLISFIIKSPWEGAQTSLHCALQEGLESKSGQYFRNCIEASSSPKSYDAGLAKNLWEKSEDMTKIKYPL